MAQPATPTKTAKKRLNPDGHRVTKPPQILTVTILQLIVNISQTTTPDLLKTIIPTHYWTHLHTTIPDSLQELSKLSKLQLPAKPITRLPPKRLQPKRRKIIKTIQTSTHSTRVHSYTKRTTSTEHKYRINSSPQHHPNQNPTEDPTITAKRKLILQHNLPMELLTITNSGIHNLTLKQFKLCDTERPLSPLEELILSLGPDFIPFPDQLKNVDLEDSILDYKIRIRRKYYNAIMGSTHSSKLQQLYLSGKTFIQTNTKCPSKRLEHYLDTVEEKLLKFKTDPCPTPTLILFTASKLPRSEYEALYSLINNGLLFSTLTRSHRHIQLINDPSKYTGPTPTTLRRTHNTHKLLLPDDISDDTPVSVVKTTRTQRENLTFLITKISKQLSNDPTIVINDTDKNLGLAIMPVKWYTDQALSHLHDPLNYVQLESLPSPLEVYTPLIQALQTINRYEPKSEQSKYIFAHLFTPHKIIPNETNIIEASKFYMLPKVHKPKIATRPIVASMNTITYNASKLVDYYLQRVMRHFPSILLNSQELNRHIALTEYPADITLFSADVTALYPSIDIDDGLHCLRKAIEIYNLEVPLEDRVDTDYIIVLTEWILNNNYMQFGKSYWKQISGTAMGTPMAVVFANLYLLILERESMAILRSNPLYKEPKLYTRFIDDVFLVADPVNGALFLNTLNSRRPRIKLEITQDTRVNYLDLTMFIVPGTDIDRVKIEVTIYQKPMNRYLYIPIFSYHQEAVFKAFITAEIKRYRLSCSQDSDFHSTCENFRERLAVRGYPYTKFDSILNSIDDTRHDLLFHFCEEHYQQHYLDIPLSQRTDFKPFRRNLTQDLQENTQLIFKIYHTPRFNNTDLHSILDMDSFQEEFRYDLHPFALKQFNGCPTLCKMRTEKIKDVLIRSAFKKDLPPEFKFQSTALVVSSNSTDKSTPQFSQTDISID